MSNESVCGNCETIQRFYGKKKKVNYPIVKQKKRDCGFYALAYAVQIMLVKTNNFNLEKNKIEEIAENSKDYIPRFNELSKIKKQLFPSGIKEDSKIMLETEFFNIDALEEFSNNYVGPEFLAGSIFKIVEFKDVKELETELEKNKDVPFLFPYAPTKNKKSGIGLHWGCVIVSSQNDRTYLIQTAKNRNVNKKVKFNGTVTAKLLYDANQSLDYYDWSKLKKNKSQQFEEFEEDVSMNIGKMMRVKME